MAYYFIHANMANFLPKYFNKEFQKFVNESFISENGEEEINNKVRKKEEDFEYFCEWHHKLCSLVANLNECYKEFIAFNLFAIITQLVLTLYVFINVRSCFSNSRETVEWIIYLILILYSLSMIVIIAAKINAYVSIYNLYLKINKE